MRGVGSIIDECGVIARDGDDTIFRREQGGRFMLEAAELREDLIGRRVAIHGILIAKATVLVERLTVQP